MKTLLAILLFTSIAYGQTPTPIPDDYYYSVKVKKETNACRTALLTPHPFYIPGTMACAIFADKNKIRLAWAMAWNSTPAQRQDVLDFLDTELNARCGDGYKDFEVKSKGDDLKTAKDAK